MGFIEQIAPYIQKYAPQYGIKVCSPILAQAILESASGTSELAINAHNYFGLKYRPNRCPSACGVYYKVGSEQNKDGSYTSSAMQWMKFSNMDNGVRGYFDFINISNYANLKGVTNPKTYLENIKKDKYATSINYVQNLMDVINKYKLTQYDNSNSKIEIPKGGNKMKVNIHAGHNPDGKVACGAVGLIKESTEARNVKDKVIAMLKSQGHTVYDCTCENGTNQNDVLKKIVSKCNEHTVDLDVSIHFNAGANDRSGNGVTTGTEVFIYNSNSKAKPYAQRIVRNIASLGFKLRDDAVKDDVKNSSYLYVLRNTKSPALLIEVCFVDDKDDVNLYNADKIAQAIVKGITGISSLTNSSTSIPSPSNTTSTTTRKYSVGQTVIYSSCYKGSTDGIDKAIMCNPNKTGVITKVLATNVNNPYLIGNGTCWVNDGDIRGSAGSASINSNSSSVSNVSQPEAKSKVTYISHCIGNGNWCSEITGYNTANSMGYSGIIGKPIDKFAVKLSQGTITYMAHKKGGSWFEEISGYSTTNSKAYAGAAGKPIDAIAIKASGIVGTLKYRVHTKADNKWWGWITGYSKTNSAQYAGVFGKEIDAIQIGIE